MIKTMKLLVVCIMSAAMLAGCAREQSAKVAASVDKDFVNAYDAFEMSKNPRAKVASDNTGCLNVVINT